VFNYWVKWFKLAGQYPNECLLVMFVANTTW